MLAVVVVHATGPAERKPNAVVETTSAERRALDRAARLDASDGFLFGDGVGGGGGGGGGELAWCWGDVAWSLTQSTTLLIRGVVVVVVVVVVVGCTSVPSVVEVVENGGWDHLGWW